jgi:elongation factor G
VDTDTGQTVMYGMGLLHLEVKQHKMERDYRLKIRVGKPLVSYRETLRRPVTAEGEFRHPSGSGVFAKVRVRFEASNNLNPTVTTAPDVALPPQFYTAAETGIRNGLTSGELGYPVIRVKATVLGGEPLDEALANEMVFEAAGANAVHKALRDNMVLLEPVMRLEVTVPEEYLGPVTADLQARRAEITQVQARGKLQVIESLVPLAKMFDYSDKVRSLTQGRASWTMEPRQYAAVPDDVQRGFFNPDGF